MKTNIFFLFLMLLLFFSPRIISQTTPPLGPALYGTNTLKDYIVYFKPSITLSEGDSGANKSWDLSKYQDAYNVLIENRNPNTAPHASNFPTATYIELEPFPGGDTIFTFYYINSAGSNFSNNVLGSYQRSNKMLLTYNKLRIVADRPLKNYGDSISNTYSASGTFDSSGVPGTIVRHGIIKRYYDAYGTLKTSWHTFTNVPRIKTVEHYTDSIVLNGILQIHNVDEENYIWTESINPLREASITHSTRDGVTRHTGFYECSICIVGIKDLNSKSFDILVYPQPASDLTIVKYYTSKEGENILSLTDLTGKILFIKKEWITAGVYEIAINTTTFPDGIYLLSIVNQENIVAKRIFLNHE